MTVRLLLINPKFGESFWSFKWAIEEIVPNKRAGNPPLGLATLAALCPRDWKIEIIDENIEPVPLQPLADIIGVCGMGVQFKRQTELLNYYRKRGYFVVAGGSYASLCPRNGLSRFPTSPERRARLTWRARGLHNLPQRPSRSARAARIGRWSTRGQPRSRAIGRTEHQSGITAALHWHRTPATGALIFLFLSGQTMGFRCSTPRELELASS